MFPCLTRGAAAAFLFVTLLAPGLAGPAAAARWDTYNNANRLNSITATGNVVWCASDLGVNRYDVGAGTFTRFSKGAGALISNSVTEIEVDPQGNTWFATRGRGVSVLKANGTWRTLDAFDGLPADTVNCLEPTADGMWVGTDAGVAFFRDFSLEGGWPDGVNPSPFASNDIKDVLQVGDSVWVATPGGAYVTKADEGVTWSRRIGGLASASLRSLTAVGDEVWCVAGGRVYRGGQTGTWTEAGEGLPATTAFNVRARGGELLLGAAAGVFSRTASTDWVLLGVGFPPSAWVDFDEDGAPWAGNFEGLWRWSGTSWTLLRSPGPLGNWIYGMALDGSKVWIATQEGGASRFDGTSWRTFAPSPGATIDTTLQSRDFLVGMFVDSRGDKWIGDWGSSIARIDDSNPTLQVTHFFGPEEGLFDAFNTFGWAAAEDRSGNVWIGLDTATRGIPPPPKGLHRIAQNGDRATFNPQSGAQMSDSQVRAIAFGPGPGFELWVGYAGRGVDIFNDPTLTTRSGRITESDALNQRLLDDDIWAIEMNGDSVWIASSAGLNRYSRLTRTRIEAIGTQPPTSQGAVHPLALDPQGGVWWGTTSGLYHRKPDRSVEVFNTANSPLLSDVITSVAVDRSNGDVWIGTTIGVNRYDPDGESGGGPPVAGGATQFNTYPNPAFTSAAGVRIFGAGVEGSFEGKVIDVRGRVIRTLRGNATNSGLWDAKDEEGRRMTPGLYFIRVTQSGVTRTGRVLLVR